ncbi:MAG: 1-deoxy-D-xylulose-5-phosphate synthase [Chlamydiae bacterium]|nr:1-deoxy-D-xylulose-5-phosphate synthase [Chlamydiota bacterium]
MEFLDNIASPRDIKHLALNELQVLAEEIRSRIIEVLSINGGHLSSNLGVVELTIALHKVFDSPQDNLLFDVSHQSYTHKLLTGRNIKFNTLRKYKGLCGFSSPKESIHDPFFAGHAGSALSLALGIAKGRDLLKKEQFVVPIIGDGSLTCGLTLEALNNIPKNLSKFIIILNDNEMAICKNVGNIKNILSRFLNNPVSNKVYQEVQTLLSKIPTLGDRLARQGQAITESLKHLVSPASFFEHLGLSYVGPIDGHNLKKMIETFSALKKANRPVIVHLITQKGQGMDAAIEDPTCYHGVRPFDKSTGKFLTPGVNTFPKIFGQEILKMADADPNLTIINPAMMAGSCLTEVVKKYPERCIDVGIAEGHALTLAGGLAYNKELKVLVSIYSTFLQRAVDNLYHDICLQNSPVVLAIDRAFLSCPDGSTHHGIYDIGILKAMPNIIIAQPRNGKMLKTLLNSAFSWKRPVAIRYPNYATLDEKALPTIELAKGEVLSKGKNLLIIALGAMCDTALEVKKLLLQEGVDATVVDPIFIKPLDTDLFYDLFMSHFNIVTIEEHALSCGLGSIFNSYAAQNGFSDRQILNIGIPDLFVEHGETDAIIKELGLDAKSISEKILSRFELKKIVLKEKSYDHCTFSK